MYDLEGKGYLTSLHTKLYQEYLLEKVIVKITGDNALQCLAHDCQYTLAIFINNGQKVVPWAKSYAKWPFWLEEPEVKVWMLLGKESF
jgi:hypothetical protein